MLFLLLPDTILSEYASPIHSLTWQVSDSLLPPDAYAQPPPVYSLFNWTLPYGPDWDLVTVPSLNPTPSPSPSLSPTGPALPALGPCGAGATPRGRGLRSGVSVPNGVRVQFKGPSEIRQACLQPEPEHLVGRFLGFLPATAVACPVVLLTSKLRYSRHGFVIAVVHFHVHGGDNKMVKPREDE